jgi:MFS superfamily sulfate permease-like transporter
MNELFGKNLKYDLKSSLVVFFVALPLCLGIAIASGAPPMSGLIAGIVGGIIVGTLSGSHVSVSGPAAGLTVIVLDSISSLGTFPIFLAAVVVSGLFQVGLGFLKAGVLGYYFPHSVIKGMLSAIGLILILKQIPHAIGYDKDLMGTMAFQQSDNQNTFSDIWLAVQYYSPGAIPIILLAMIILIGFEHHKIKKSKVLSAVPPALWAVISGILINQLYITIKPEWILDEEHLVTIPELNGVNELGSLFTLPDFGLIGTSSFWVVAATIAIIGSIESLLSLEAGDKMDPQKRISPPNRELVAQGIGNTVSGLIGGLPVTAVIVRTSANITSGAKTKLSAIFHGILLAILVVAIPTLLNKIPLSCLAAVLIIVGFKLAKPSIFVHEWEKGLNQFLPFVATIIAILFTDLLTGIGIGMVVGMYFVIKTNFKQAITVTERNGNYLVKFNKDVSFLNKAPLKNSLAMIPENSFVIINGIKAKFIDQDIRDVLNAFIESAHDKNIKIKIEGFDYNQKENA